MKILRQQKGFTLIEMLIVVAILGTIMAPMAMAVQMIYSNFNIARDDSIALRQVENAGYWITNDIKRAKTVSMNTPGILHLVCYYWNDSTSSMIDNQQVDYTISNGELIRTTVTSTATSNMLVAQYIVTANIVLAPDEIPPLATKPYILTVEASYQGKIESRHYKAAQRIPG
jgi:prepilin-type N-terminal cleavage/methylation domain-containing protein